MAVFAYKALDATGRTVAGTLLADSATEGRRQLRARGVNIEHFAPAATRSSSAGPAGLQWTSRARRQACVAEFARLLALLLRSGVPLREGLDSLIAQAHGRWRVVLQQVRSTFDAGASLSDSLAESPQWFGPIVRGAVRVGEQAGTLEGALDEVAGYLKDQQLLTTRVKTALVYPLILAVTSCGVVLFLMTYVLPQLLTVLESSGGTLPASTRLLKGVSDLILAYWPLLLAAALVSASGWTLALRTRRGRRLWHRTVLSLPLLGIVVRKSLIAQLAQQISMMLTSGVTFPEALATVRSMTRNVVLEDELAVMEQAIGAGSDIAPALAHSRIFPALVRQLIAVGQESGELTEVLNQLRSGYETEVRLAVDKFTAALEPLLIIVMATVIGFIVFATILPILETTRVMI